MLLKNHIWSVTMKTDCMKSILLPLPPHCITFFSEDIATSPSATIYSGFILYNVQFENKNIANKYLCY